MTIIYREDQAMIAGNELNHDDYPPEDRPPMTMGDAIALGVVMLFSCLISVALIARVLL